MPAYDVLGKGVVVEQKIGDYWFPVFCATVNTFDLEQEVIETTNVNSGPNREFVPGMATATVSVSGITRVNNLDSRANIIYLVQQSVRRQIHSLRMVIVNQVSPTPEVAVISFNALIKTTNITSEKSLLSNCSVTYTVTGGISFDTLVPPPPEPVCEVQDPLYIDAVEGQTSVSHALLQQDGVVILEVQRSGIGHAEITVGTPVNNQFTFTGGSGFGTIQFPTAIPFNPGEVVYVLYKIVG